MNTKKLELLSGLLSLKTLTDDIIFGSIIDKTKLMKL